MRNSASVNKTTHHDPATGHLADACNLLNVLFPVETTGAVQFYIGENYTSETGDLPALLIEADDKPVYVSPTTTAGEVAFLAHHLRGASDGEWATLNLPPSAVLTNGEDAVALYALWPLSDPSAATPLAAAMGVALNDLLPLPGEVWTFAHHDAKAFYTLDEVAAVFGAAPVEPHHDDADYATLLDARLLTPLDLDAAELQQEMVISVGANFQSKKWKNNRMPIAKLIAILAKHPEGKQKDGPGFVLAEIVGDNRKKHAVSNCYGVGLDIDVGMPGSEIDELLKQFGHLAIRYTTFSHAKTTSKLNRDKIVKWCDQEQIEFDGDAVIRFLREKSRWDEAILATAEYVGDEHEATGLMACISHAPMERHRIVLPLADPFDPTKVAKTHAQGMSMWAEVCRALARRLGDLPMDNAATDPSRLFYFPRHAKGRPHETTIVGGPLFDWKTLDLTGDGAEEVEGDEFDKALAAEIKQNEKASPKSKSKTDEGKKLGRWAIKAAHGFQIADVIRDHADDRIRTPGSSKISIECPFDEDHSNPGDPEDRGCYAVNAGDGPSEIFTIKCQHDSCQGKTNLDHLGKMIKDDWFPEEVLRDDQYNVAEVGDSQQPEVAAKAEYEAALSSLHPASPDADANTVARLIVAARLSPRQRVAAEEALRKALGLTVKKPVQAMLREAEIAVSEAADYAEAEADAGRFTELKQVVPLPGQEFGRFSYRGFGGRPWTHRHDERLFTPWAITAGLEYPDRAGAKGLRFTILDENSKLNELDLLASVTIEDRPLKAALRERGVGMTPKGAEAIIELARQIQPPNPLLVYDRGGWRADRLFLSPWGDAISDKPSEATVAANARPKGDSQAGCFEEWKAAATAAFNTGLVQLQTSVLAAFAAPIIDLCKLPSSTVFYSGGAGLGKSTGHALQASAWGTPEPKRGLFGTFDVTAGAPEALLAQSSGAGCSFDEVKLMKGGDLQRLIFQIYSDSGRSRLERDASGLRATRNWWTFVTMSYEHSLEHKIKADGETVMTGLGARCLEIAVDEARLKPEVMAPVDAIKSHYGHAGPAFVQALFDQGYVSEPARLEREIEGLADKLLAYAPTEQRRAARIAAQMWKAGEIATEAGLMPMRFALAPPIEAVLESADLQAHDMRSAELPPRTFMKKHGIRGHLAVAMLGVWKRSRETESASTSPLDKAMTALIRNLALRKWVADRDVNYANGFKAKRIDAFKGDFRNAVYVVPLEHLPEYLEGPQSPKAVIAKMGKKGWLEPYKRGDDRRQWVWDHVPGFANVRSIVIPANVIEDEDQEN